MAQSNHPGMSDAAIKAKTGRTWPQWVKALDAAGARTLDHRDIVKLVHAKFGLGPWWQQMVAVGYERLMGKRALYQKADGFSASISKTCAVSPKALFSVFDNAKTRKKLLGADVSFSTRAPTKGLRFAWPKGGRVVIAFIAKGAGKTQITVEHAKLPKATDVARMKKFWRGVIAKAETAAAN